MTAGSSRVSVLLCRAASVIAGLGAVVLLAPTVLAPRPASAALWAVLWIGAAVMTAVSVRVWRAADREARTPVTAGPARGLVLLCRSVSVMAGVGAAVLLAVILTSPQQPSAVLWFVTAEVALGAVAFWWIAKRCETWNREPRAER